MKIKMSNFYFEYYNKEEGRIQQGYIKSSSEDVAKKLLSKKLSIPEEEINIQFITK